MGMAAILVMCPKYIEQTFVPSMHECTTFYLAMIDLVVLEKRMFENMVIYSYMSYIALGAGIDNPMWLKVLYKYNVLLPWSFAVRFLHLINF